MNFLILFAMVGSIVADGGEHHHPHGGDHHATPDQYGAPLDTPDSYGAPQDAPVYAAQTPQYQAPTSQYGAPQQEYGAPAQEYGAPAQEYGVPAQEYAAPVPEYAAPTGYEAPVYETEVAKENLFDLSSLSEMLPLFLAVIAAIIVAQIFAPLLGSLFGAKFSLLSGIFSPLGAAKLGLFNAILAPFNIAICDISGTTPTVVAGRSDASGFSVNQDTIDLAADLLYKAIDNYNSL